MTQEDRAREFLAHVAKDVDFETASKLHTIFKKEAETPRQPFIALPRHVYNAWMRPNRVYTPK